MKKTLIGRIFSVMMSVIIIASIFVIPASAATNTSSEFWRNILKNKTYSEITLPIYDTLEEVFEQTKAPASIEYVYEATFSSLDEAKLRYNNDFINNYLIPTYYYVYNDHPEYFWLETACSVNVSVSYRGNDYTITYTVKPSYCVTSNLTAAKSSFDNAVSTMTSGLSGKSDYEKSLILHDRLIENTDYVQSGAHQSAYGALVAGKAVCAGYARAYKVLLDKVGIQSYYLTGKSADPNSGKSVNHSWNAVKLDGSWYYSDATWDDQDTTTYYAQFNVTKARISEDHTFDSEIIPYLPNATATAANYFTKNGCILTGYDLNAIVNHLDKNDLTARFYYSGTAYSSASAFYKANIYDKASGVNVFADIVEGLGYKNAGYSYSIKSCGREFIISITITSGTKEETTTTAKVTTTTTTTPKATTTTTTTTTTEITTTPSTDITTTPPTSEVTTVPDDTTTPDTSVSIEDSKPEDTSAEESKTPEDTSVSEETTTPEASVAEPSESDEDEPENGGNETIGSENISIDLNTDGKNAEEVIELKEKVEAVLGGMTTGSLSDESQKVLDSALEQNNSNESAVNVYKIDFNDSVDLGTVNKLTVDISDSKFSPEDDIFAYRIDEKGEVIDLGKAEKISEGGALKKVTISTDSISDIFLTGKKLDVSGGTATVTTESDNTVYIIIGVAAALIVVGVIVGVILNKKKKAEREE